MAGWHHQLDGHGFGFQCLIGLFIISISSWFSLGRLNFSKDLSISSRLSILLTYRYILL